MFIYRLIMLLDKEHEADFNERINKAFRYYDSEKAVVDEELFESYVRGGVDVLYENCLVILLLKKIILRIYMIFRRIR